MDWNFLKLYLLVLLFLVLGIGTIIGTCALIAYAIANNITIVAWVSAAIVLLVSAFMITEDIRR